MRYTRLSLSALAALLVSAQAVAAGPIVNPEAMLDPAARLLLAQPMQQQAPGREAAGAGTLCSVYIQYDPAVFEPSDLEALEARLGTATQGLATLTLPLARLAELATLPGITYVQAPHPAHLQLDLARQDTRADEAQTLLSATASSASVASLPGTGIIIGQVDAGLDYRHNAFRTADGTLRIARVWEQGTNPATAPIPGLHSPAQFGYGAEFDTPELIYEAGADSNAGSHGTHVMGIAAGSDTYLDGQFRGIAPGAELVMVAITDTGADNVCISDAIKYIFDYADQQGKPCVINLSLGDHMGPHDGTSPFDQLADAMQGPGRLIVGSAGNYGADRFHICRHLSQPASDIEDDGDSLQVLLPHEFYSQYRYGDIDLWAEPSLTFALELYDLNTFSGSEAEVKTMELSELLDGQAHTLTLGRNVTGNISLTAEVNPLNGKTHILLRSYVTALRTNHQVALRLLARQGNGQVDLWADDAKIHFNAPERPGYATATTEATITEIGGTSRRILSVGAYTTRDQFQLEGSNEVYPVGMELDALCTFSGYGPTADGRQKPEVCAPGSFIVSAVSGFDVTGPYLYSHYNDAKGHPQRYGYLQGTSMSAPHVTGAVALWLQAYPQLTPEELHEVIAATSSSTRHFASGYDPRFWGAGKLDVCAGLEYCLNLADQHDGIEEVRPDDVLPSWADAPCFDLMGRRIHAEQRRGGMVVMKGSKGILRD